MNTAQHLKDNRDSIILSITNEIRRVTNLYGKAKCDLKQAMVVYKEVLEATENAGKAREASEKAIKGNLRLSSYANISEAAIRQLPSSMR